MIGAKNIFKFLPLLFLALILTGCGQAPTNTTPPSQQASTTPATTIPAGRFYFYSAGCPHCETVASYVQEHDMHQRMYYIERKVGPESTSDNNLLKAIAKRCAIPEASLSVPLFWDGGACYMGDQAVIDYFNKNLQ